MCVILAYDGPQAFELGNPDLLDPPVQVLRVSDDRGDKAAPPVGEAPFFSTPFCKVVN